MASDAERGNGRHQADPFHNHQPDKHHRPVNEPHANAATNGHAPVAETTVFGPLLLRNGNSPVPIEPGCKRPLAAVGDWNRLRDTPLTVDEIAAITERHPNAGLGVVGGYHGLVPIDIDTEDADIQAAIDAVMPGYLVAKRGRRGATVFFRDLLHAEAQQAEPPVCLARDADAAPERQARAGVVLARGAPRD